MLPLETISALMCVLVLLATKDIVFGLIEDCMFGDQVARAKAERTAL